MSKTSIALGNILNVIHRVIHCFALQKRGAKIYAEFRGGSFTSDAYHVTEPRPDGKMLNL